MAKQYKIKRYHKGSRSVRARPHPLTILVTGIILLALIAVGIVIYQPVIEFVRGALSGAGTTPSQNEPLPEPEPISEEPVSEPEETEPAATAVSHGELRMAYLPTATAGNPEALNAFLAQLEGTDVNTVLVDIKNAAGNVLYNSAVPQAAEWGAIVEAPLDLAAISGTLQQKQLHLAVRISAFQDPIASGVSREFAIHYQDTDTLWLDNAPTAGGQPWLNPYSQGAKDYVINLAKEAANSGAVMVVLENVMFPLQSATQATFGDTGGLDRKQALQAFVESCSTQLAELGCETALYYTALTLTQGAENETRYGGSPLELITDTLIYGALPYQFNDGFSIEGLTIEQPVQNPGGAVEAILGYLLDNSSTFGDTQRIIPMLQGGTESGVNAEPFAKVQVDAQISAINARGLAEYVLYTTDGTYTLK